MIPLTSTLSDFLLIDPPASCSPETFPPAFIASKPSQEDPLELPSIFTPQKPLSPCGDNEKRIQDNPEGIIAPLAALPNTITVCDTKPIAAISSAYQIPPEVLSLFDRICTEMLVMTSEASQKTTIALNGESFASSPFYGAEITIEEFSTAPKIFNVTITTPSQSASLLQAHLLHFSEILQARKFSFSINRIDTDLLYKPDFSRSSQEEEQNLDQEQKDRRHS